ncbi:hypothetical protein FVEG_15511 [Fusarium verticillioides 7600]|uniref:Uncharacterized protein n=1 Tax=Gibberella moniliformis (strain M3125 / FGSC 7600) TaxID=334819 RepID=W7LWH4_GIBM7|nr:hypothetical protein FVEG_15511 [Fusarium verticillioides 7600]XP_018749098.1 hypothetical protein FVEG_15511 [Fusarium verticillioides 7600]XP_018749099.1 hypothetical protein FVEG_15511 [Fusarium verticillioides 7600]EWG42906.1 hypothetical protein FVEG_15511 [Fusarium verticillioides 7600]EWG42907.1 hypothetical protein FVEG_15511 [Fusarium verticillioides 7600]EWG42908.1 hypothetical protein FVEG_15511 [Fusarium verticillioides 7600]
MNYDYIILSLGPSLIISFSGIIIRLKTKKHKLRLESYKLIMNLHGIFPDTQHFLIRGPRILIKAHYLKSKPTSLMIDQSSSSGGLNYWEPMLAAQIKLCKRPQRSH